MEVTVYDYRTDYKAFKQELDSELSKAADGFVKIGYLLKLARDTDILAESGYTSIADFAKAEYGLTKDVVSRYININDRYSEGGNSPCLADRYKGFGVAKLAEMLTLPDAIVDNISADTTKEEIKLIKKEYAEEQEISDIEVAIEKAEVEQQKANAPKSLTDIFKPDNNMKQLIYDYLHDNPEEYIQLSKATDAEDMESAIAAVLVPSGDKSIIARVPGVGKLIMTIHTPGTDIVIVNMRSGEKEIYNWDNLKNYIHQICQPYDLDSYKELWKCVYGEEWSYEPPKEEPVKESSSKPEPAKPTEKKKPKDEPKKAKRKESKVSVVKKDKPAVKESEPVEDKDKIVSEEQMNSAKSVVLTGTLSTISDEELEDVINNSSGAEEYPEVAPVQPENEYDIYSNMPKDKLMELFQECYNQMDEEYQTAKKHLREYSSLQAGFHMKNSKEMFDKVCRIADVLSELEDESDD